jgi:hypothetical protein
MKYKITLTMEINQRNLDLDEHMIESKNDDPVQVLNDMMLEEPLESLVSLMDNYKIIDVTKMAGDGKL